MASPYVPHDPPRCHGALRVVYLRESQPVHAIVRVGRLCKACHAFLPDAGYEAVMPPAAAAVGG